VKDISVISILIYRLKSTDLAYHNLNKSQVKIQINPHLLYSSKYFFKLETSSGFYVKFYIANCAILRVQHGRTVKKRRILTRRKNAANRYSI